MKKCVVCEKNLTGVQQKYCCNNCKQKHHWHRVKTQFNSYHSQTIRAYKRKLELIELKGGACMNCGYDKNISVLQFHHRDPNEKKFSLDSRKLSNTKYDLLLEEANKCDLLCANCHSEHHYPEMDMKNIKNILNNHNK